MLSMLSKRSLLQQSIIVTIFALVLLVLPDVLRAIFGKPTVSYLSLLIKSETIPRFPRESSKLIWDSNLLFK